MPSAFNKKSQLREIHHMVKSEYCPVCGKWHPTLKGCKTSIILTEMVHLNQELFSQSY